MAKTPPEQYFNVLVRRVGRTKLGDLIVSLSALDLTDFQPELVTDVVTFNKKQSHEVKAEDFLVDWIAEHPEFQAKDAIKHFREAGRTDGSGYTALRNLVARKLLRKMGEGRYTTLAKKHQPPKAKAAKVAKAKKAKVPTFRAVPAKKRNAHHDVSNADFLLRGMSRAHGKMSSAAIKRLFENDGRPSTGVGPTLHKLRQVGMIKQLGEGMYELTARAGKKPAPKKPVTNGSAHPIAPVAEVTA